MSFSAVTTGEIASGEPVTSTTQTKVKNNFDDHETRIEALEAVTVDFIPITLCVNGYYQVGTDVLKTTANSTIYLTGARILIDQAGSAGTTQVDLQRKRGGGAYTTIFSTLPSVAYGAGNDAVSSNGVINPSMTDFIAGDILRLDITSIQTDAKNFLVRLDYNRG